MKKGTELWLVGKHIQDVGDEATAWEFGGVFATEDEAVAACTADEFFVFPAILGEALPDETYIMPGCYYPRVEPDKAHTWDGNTQPPKEAT